MTFEAMDAAGRDPQLAAMAAQLLCAEVARSVGAGSNPRPSLAAVCLSAIADRAAPENRLVRLRALQLTQLLSPIMICQALWKSLEEPGHAVCMGSRAVGRADAISCRSSCAERTSVWKGT